MPRLPDETSSSASGDGDATAVPERLVQDYRAANIRASIMQRHPVQLTSSRAVRTPSEEMARVLSRTRYGDVDGRLLRSDRRSTDGVRAREPLFRGRTSYAPLDEVD